MNIFYYFGDNMTQKCPNCGSELPDEYIFCPDCETQLRNRNEYKQWNPVNLDAKEAEKEADRRGVKIKLVGLFIILIIGLIVAFLYK